MTDVKLNWQAESFIADMSLAGKDLATGDDLTTAVIMSLFTWRRAKADDALPDYETTRMGWWADNFPAVESDKIGSRLWLLRREKMTQETIARAIEYVQEALAWMVDDKIATRVDVVAERQGLGMLAMSVTIHRRDGTVRALDFQNVWEAVQNG